jgi:hypothetical protein
VRAVAQAFKAKWDEVKAMNAKSEADRTMLKSVETEKASA